MSKSPPGSPRPAQTVGRRIHQHRRAQALTLEHLAERAGLSSNFLATVENGRRDPRLSEVIAIAKGLGVTPAELFGVLPGLTPPAEELARLFDSLPWLPINEPPTPFAPAGRVPVRFALPFFGLETRHQIAPWWPRRAAGS